VVTLELTASGRGLVASADAWRRQELARILALLAPAEQRALTTALGLLVAAAGEGYGVTAVPPAPL
jgi:DNA-binding MarR family transcriptional regulator